MRVSFIIPYHNEPEELVRQCIESIVCLKSITPGEREIIIVDDGSTTDISGLLNDYTNDIIYIRQQNAGPGAARNNGIEKARGEWIQFVDCDDWLISERYDECLKLTADKTCDLVMFDFTREPEKEEPACHTYSCSGVEYMLHNNMKAHPVLLLFRRPLLGDLRFERGLFHEDELFTPQLVLRAKNLMVTTTRAYYYRTREGSTMTRRDSKWLAHRLDCLETVIHRLNDRCMTLDGDSQKALRRKTSQLTMDYLYNSAVLTQCVVELWRRSRRLKRDGLYPLPLQFYTWKYLLFALTTHII